MNIKSYLQRLKLLASEGMILGAISTFLLSWIYTFLCISYIVSLLAPVTLGEIIGSIGLWTIIGLAIWFMGGIPATIIGTLGGAIIGSVLALREKKAGGVLAGFIGLIVAIILTS